MCCQHDEHSHNIYIYIYIYMLPQQKKTGAKSVLGDSKFDQIMNIQSKEEIAYHLTCL